MRRLNSIVNSNQSFYVQFKDLNRAVIFYEPDDRYYLIEVLKKYSCLYDLKLHAYAILDNFVHLFLTNCYEIELSHILNFIVSEYSDYFNFTYRRKNKLLDMEYSIQTNFNGCSFLSIYRYIELSPVWNGIASHPKDYPWSSYGSNAFGENTDLLSPHPEYVSLASNNSLRRMAYRNLFNN